jgi:hypothetical protein
MVTQVDHMDYVLTSFDMFIGTTDNLINYTFNVRIRLHSQIVTSLTFIGM